MHLTLSQSVINLYKKEMELTSGEYVRLFVRVGGVGSGGFSVGIMRDTAPDNAYIIEAQNVHFFVTEDDFWYLDGMTIEYNSDLDRVEFIQPRFVDAFYPEEQS